LLRCTIDEMGNMNEVLFDIFRDEELAYRFLEAQVWGEKPKCPRCESTDRIGELRGSSTQIGTYKCYRCRKLFTVKGGTIFERSHVPLRLWLQAAYLCGCGTKAVKPQRLVVILGVTYKTAVLIIQRLERAATQKGLGAALSLEAPTSDERKVRWTPREQKGLHDPLGR
jgi:transposase-like protein